MIRKKNKKKEQPYVAIKNNYQIQKKEPSKLERAVSSV